MRSTSEGSKSCASFRDPDGFVYEKNGLLLRQVNRSYASDYEHLIGCGLYGKLQERQWLVAHEDAPITDAWSNDAYKVIRPRQIPFISYPYEWCFEQLRQAALLTLSVQRMALEHGMSLKDASAYNVQYVGSRPLFIDTLSFARLEDGMPWYGYRQFCQQFLAPLLLGRFFDGRMNKLSLPFVDGIPLDLASKLLPWHSWWRLPVVLHIHMQANLQKAFLSGSQAKQLRHRLPLKSQLAIVDDLASLIDKLPGKRKQSGWVHYYEENSYGEETAAAKVKLVDGILNELNGAMVWDLGANTGRFSRLSAWQGLTTVAFDQDEACVQQLFLEGFKMKEERCLPLVLDLANPTPASGWQHTEHRSLEQRGPADCVLALALIHHLLITCEVSMERIAEFFSKIARRLIIEFVAEDDWQVGRLLAGIRRSFHPIDKEAFEREFSRFFEITGKHQLPGSSRIIYDCRRKP